VLGVGVLLGLAAVCSAGAATRANAPGEITFTAAKGYPKRDSLYGVRSNGKALRTILRDVTHQTWSPDGSRVAYYGLVDCHGFCVAKANGRGNYEVLHADCGSGADIAWAPDGSRLALACEPGARIVVVGADGKHAKRVRYVGGGGFPQIAGLAWSPDGRTISYYATKLVKGKLRGSLEIVKPDGSRRLRLSTTSGFAAVDARTSWVRDGSTLAFQLNEHFFALFDFRRHVVANVQPGSWATFSPNGKKLAFVEKGGIYVVDAGSGKANQVVKGGAAPAWSPDSASLAFVASGPRIAVVDANGRNGRFVTRSWADVLDVAWRSAG
jgi:Tol biopolymer transport system component